jgi:hypothetical protein
MNLKLSAWYFLHDKNKFWSDFRKGLHILTVEKSEYYEECEKFYSTLDVKNKIVFDIGCDFGTTPMYFLSKGAVTVFGFSKGKQYFRNIHYKHYNVEDDSHILSTTIRNIQHIKNIMSPPTLVLKSDCEGCEWNFTKEFIEAFDDWIIAVHTPITNEPLYQYIKENGKNIGNQISGKNRIVEEIGIYKKVLK